MDRSAANRIEQIASRGSGERAERHRRIGRAEGREPHFGDRLLLRGGGDGERVHVGKLALVGRHAGRRIALDVLDRPHALLHRKLDVLDADVVLIVDEGLDAAVAEDMQRRAERPAGGSRRALDRRDPRFGGDEARRHGGCTPGCVALGERVGKTEHSVAGACRPLALNRRSGPEHLRDLVKRKLAARLRKEMDRGRPASGHQEGVAGKRAHAERIGGEAHGGYALPALNLVNCGLGRDLQACRTRPRPAAVPPRRRADPRPVRP